MPNYIGIEQRKVIVSPLKDVRKFGFVFLGSKSLFLEGTIFVVLLVKIISIKG
jgi:hypothetical protein